IVSAYDRLISEGYLESRQPVGTFVASSIVGDGPASPLAATHKPGTTVSAKRRARLIFQGRPHAIVSPYPVPVPLDFWVGRPDARLFPIKDWMQIMRRKLRDMQIGNSGY